MPSYPRGPEATSVKKELAAHYKEMSEVPDFSVAAHGAIFDELALKAEVDSMEINFDQLEYAAQNKLYKLLYPTFRQSNEGTCGQNFIAAELNALLQEEAKPASLAELQEALKKRVAEKNQKKEMIDRETFELIVKKYTPVAFLQAPEYESLKEAARNESWKGEEERAITRTFIQPSKLEMFYAAIDKLFADEAAQAVLSRFL